MRLSVNASEGFLSILFEVFLYELRRLRVSGLKNQSGLCGGEHHI